MSGKSYGIREMKTIVEYLTENKLYGEIRGRKMWMNFANTQLTTRTWQSLKETFLKRILPDIHNPYYSLSTEQINSFRAGYDVSDKNKNKLEIHTVSDESNDQTENDTPQTDNDYGIKEEIMAGENIKCSKIPSQNRSSADTVIVDTCYETAEDIQKDLESPGGDKETKSLRDCITYSEPLTPMLQEVLDEFQSEPENEPETSDRENQVETIHTVPDSDNITKETSEPMKEHDNTDNGDNNISKKATDSTIDKRTDSKVEVNESKDDSNKNIQESTSDKKHLKLADDSPDNSVQEAVKSVIEENQFESENHKTTKSQLVDNAISLANDSENTDVVVVHDSNSEIIHPSDGLNNSNSTTDASLPNNPEALKKVLANKNDTKLHTKANNTNIKGTRKRSNSEDTEKITNNKKTRLNRKQPKATSETEGKGKIETISELKPIYNHPNDKSIEIANIPKKTDKTNQNKKDPVSLDTIEKPSTSKNNNTDQVLIISDADQSPNINESSEIKNPCLQNVSLFDEQFNKTKYNTSESEGESIKKKTKVNKDKTEDNKVTEKQNKRAVVVLKSHSESDTELPTSSKKKHRPAVMSSKTERDRALANVFGFSSGAANSKQQRQLTRRRRTISQNNVLHNNGRTDSSEWTSDLESEAYVSPPRSRKNRQTKKYLKPQSGRILSLEEEGGLFVMYGKKIYPLVKDGKLVKNYLTYLPESDSEDEHSYWKLKYEEEKKKAEELKRLLQKAKEPKSRRSTSPSAHPIALRNSTCSHSHAQGNTNETGKEVCIPKNNEKKLEPVPASSENIKIKFTTKNDEEIHLEGNWPQIHNVLEHVVHIFHKEPQPISSSRSKSVVEPPSSVPSGISTPVVITAVQEPGVVDLDVHETVNKIESEIFKEIEERDKNEKDEPNGQENNVTKRKVGRPRKSSQSSVSQSPAKIIKTSEISDLDKPEINATNDKVTEETVNVDTSDSSKKQLRTPRKTLNESLNNDTKTVQTRRTKLNTSLTNEAKDDEEVRYMFPPKTRRQTAKAITTDKNSKAKSHKSTVNTTKRFSSPETVCSNSLESTQGYQDSDPSPMKMEFRKKKMINVSEMKYKTISHLRRSSRKKSHPYLRYDGGESNNLSHGKIGDRDNSTLNSNVYRSESYELLMPGTKKPLRKLDSINETSPMGIEVQFVDLDSTIKNKEFSSERSAVEQNTGQADSEFGSSSNISLPLSPELSVVESFSVSKDLIKTMEVGPTINDIQYILDVKLRDLLLESAKKISKENEMDVDETNVVVQKKTRNKKRCSTPRKRQNSTRSKKVPKVQTLVEEEHTESFAKGGRQSCPPVIQALMPDEQEEIDIARLTIGENVKSKSRKKKDIIKVKILKPKRKKSENGTTKSVEESKKSLLIDSGINDTESGVFLRGDESVDLIHNHSETCLQANDCIDSLEFVENSVKSILTIEDSIQSADDILWKSQSEFFDDQNIVPEFFCNDAQDVNSFYNSKPHDIETCETVYHSPLGTESSLITEDLSDDLQQSVNNDKWYLLSEDETRNTNTTNLLDNPVNVTSFGANLKQIFPITCAVPDLSTITEISRESNNSRRPVNEIASGEGFDSQSIFDSNF
ncbi:unnamed protein product [Arctia plantaginis]|uniref:Rap1 Myb domain-containing protein n=1 Tax=Arctia plantaginis TaxID=874455 RepID=A0A8S0ZN35_ARCPL|nr:unnamed protein product [Arctia plantaginis]